MLSADFEGRYLGQRSETDHIHDTQIQNPFFDISKTAITNSKPERVTSKFSIATNDLRNALFYRFLK